MNRIEYNQLKEKLYIQEDGEYEVVLKTCEKVEIVLEENIEALVFLKLVNSKKVNIEIQIAKDAKLRLLHHFEEDITIDENAHLLTRAQLESGFYTLHPISSTIKVKYYLKEEEASVKLITSSITTKENLFDIECIHKVPHTSSYMENYAICKENGNYTIVASGKIEKGARGSKSHQATRVLTMGEKQNTSVTPLLLIDENDVEASHASALGAMNEDHLYYLQTRGLNQEQALGLLTLSYVLPILRIVEASDFYEQVEKEIESKVGLSC